MECSSSSPRDACQQRILTSRFFKPLSPRLLLDVFLLSSLLLVPFAFVIMDSLLFTTADSPSSLNKTRGYSGSLTQLTLFLLPKEALELFYHSPRPRPDRGFFSISFVGLHYCGRNYGTSLPIPTLSYLIFIPGIFHH
jgi:hypothetical protein